MILRMSLKKLLVPLAVLALFVAGCGDGDDAPSVTLYTSVDPAYSRPIVEQFEADTGIRVDLKTDTEANKSVGLAERLRAERDRPLADVWWGNEPFLTVALADEGLFEAYASESAADVPEQFRDAEHRWHGNGLRARVFAVAEGVEVASLEDLASPALRDKVVVARPTAGTTGSHVAALYVAWGEPKFDAFFRSLHANGARLVSGNGPSAEAVATGNASVGLTDNDDVASARRNLDASVRTLVPDQAEGGLGTLAIPTTIALVKRDRDERTEAAARSLVDRLASAQVERALREAEFTIADVRGGEMSITSMPVDYTAAAAALPEASRRATALLEGR